MKKIVSLALCMMLLVGLCFALASCKCKHEWGAEVKVEPTCTEDGKYIATCTKCGEKTEYAPDTTELDMKAKGHTEDAGTVITEPTCTTAGTMEIKCTECEVKVKDKEIPALGHDIDADEFKTDGTNHWNECSVCQAKQNETACTWEMVALDEQKHAQSCSVCESLKAGSEADHTLGTATVTVESTCSVAGKQTQTCTTCGVDIESAVPTKPHTWGTTYKTDGTNHWYACTACDAPNPDSVAAHTLGTEQTYTPEATSCENGKKYKVCSVCEGEVVLEIIPSANPHATIVQTVVDDKVSYACAACDLEWTADMTSIWDGTNTDGWSPAGENSNFQTHTGATLPEIVDGHYEYVQGPDAGKHQYQTWYRLVPINPETATQALISIKLKPAAGGLPTGLDGINLTDDQPTDRKMGYGFKLVEENNGAGRWSDEWNYNSEVLRVDGVGDIYGWVTETVDVEGTPTTVPVKLGSLSATEWTTITFTVTFDTENDKVITTYYVNGAYAGEGSWNNTTLNNGFESLYQGGYTNVVGTGMCIDDLIIAWEEVK